MDPAEQSGTSRVTTPTEPISRPVRLPIGRDDELAAGVHEVQNALTSVLGWLEIARASRDEKLRERALEVISSGVQRARVLVAQLADPTERFSVRTQAFQLGPLLHETYELLHPRCTAVGVELIAHAPDDDVLAAGDPDRVVQVVTNLVLNAVDAVLALPGREPGRGRVEVSVESDERHVCVVVRDDGIGMDEATLARVFEPYFTTHPTASGRRKAGTGLGLAISRALAEAMRGRLEVRSKAGSGSTMKLILARDGVAPSVAPPSDKGVIAGTRVLVVDDEPAIRELLEVALALRGADVTMVASLSEARHALAHHTYDVALVDESLGNSDSGAALLIDLAEAMPAMASVLMTGAPTVEHLPAEACRWLLRKPFSLDDVVRMIAAAIEAQSQGAATTPLAGK